MKKNNVKTIATVKSFSHNHERYHVVLHNRHVQCSCLDWFFRRRPCKHIRSIRTLHHVAVGEMVQKKVELTPHGVKYLARWRKRHGMPLVRPEGYKPPPKDEGIEAQN